MYKLIITKFEERSEEEKKDIDLSRGRDRYMNGASPMIMDELDDHRLYKRSKQMEVVLTDVEFEVIRAEVLKTM